MKWKEIKKIMEGRFITRYDIVYETEDHKEKTYEMISRNKNIKKQSDLTAGSADGVVIIVHDETGEKICLNREYRLAVGEWVYNFPAGMVDPGETPEQSAIRELREETGLKLVKIEDVLRESYSAVGFSNEKNKCVIGIAKGEFAPSTSSVEEIISGWYTKEQVRDLLKTQVFAGRTQAYCYEWSKK